MEETNGPSQLAIDFETANSSRGSVCAIGLCLVERGVATYRSRVLVRPPELRFDSMNVMIHGITAADVADKPEFDHLWRNGLSEVFGSSTPLVAHYAPFDMSVLRHVLDTYGIVYPALDYFCTWAIARRSWPRLNSHSLDSVAAHLGIDFEHHHPTEDARACAEIALLACRRVGAPVSMI